MTLRRANDQTIRSHCQHYSKCSPQDLLETVPLINLSLSCAWLLRECRTADMSKGRYAYDSANVVSLSQLKA